MTGRKRRASSVRRQWAGVAFAAPAVVGLLWFTAYPVLASLAFDIEAFQGADWR